MSLGMGMEFNIPKGKVMHLGITLGMSLSWEARS